MTSDNHALDGEPRGPVMGDSVRQTETREAGAVTGQLCDQTESAGFGDERAAVRGLG